MEQRSTATDRHGRVPSAENPLVAAGQSRRPVVSLLAMELRRAVRRGGWKASGPHPGAVARPPSMGRAVDPRSRRGGLVGAVPLLRMLELGMKGSWDLAGRVGRAARRSFGRDPVSRGVHSILQLEAHHGIRPTWFVICARPTLGSRLAGDATYNPEGSSARRILTALTHAGHEIGLHGSFATGTSAARMAEERRSLSRLADTPVTGVRQHFLRMRPGQTQQHMVAAGLEYDATWGFADRNGFRLGVADIVPAWDAGS